MTLRRATLCLSWILALGLLAPSPAVAEYVSTRVGSFSTSSATFVDVTGGSLEFTPDAAGDVWILLLGARLMSTATALAPEAAEVRYLVNGVEHGYGGTQNQIANKGGPWQHFYRVTGTTAKQTVRVQIRDNTGATATIQDLSIVAFLLPAGADFQYVETETTQNVPPLFANYESLSFTPGSPGTYLVMALANATESPGSGGIGVRVQDPFGSFWPIDSKANRLGHLSNPRVPWASFFVARAQSLTATPQIYNLQADGDAISNSTLKYTRLMAFRTDAFDNFETVENTASSSTASTTPVVKSTLTTAAPPSSRDYIVIQSQVLNGTDSTDEIRAGFEIDDVVKMSHDHVISTQWNLGSYGLFDAVTTSRAVKYENTYATSNAAAPVDSKESVIHVLRLASNSCPCEALSAVDGGTSVTVTSAASFQMTFDEAFGGSLQDYRDLAQDPSLNLVSKPASNFHGVFHTSVNSAGTLYTSGTNADGAKVDLLEATPTRMKVRQEHFYQRVLLPTFLGGLKGIGDYSIYPTGKLAIRFNRKATASIPFSYFPLESCIWQEIAPDPRSGLTGYSESGTFAGNNPGGDDFILAQRENTGAKTDFLGILSADWAAADQLEFNNVVAFYSWRDVTAGTLPMDETWNLLFYLKQTGFVNHLDPGVTGRRDDYRGPDALSFGKGSVWSDVDENTASDDFNEAEAAYLMTVDTTPSTGGLTVSLDGEATNRYVPFFKARHWRSLQDPATVTLDGVTMTNDLHYRADVKPFARAYFAETLLWHSTLQNADSVDTTPDIGSAGAVGPNVTGFVAGRYGSGLHIPDDTNAYVDFPIASNFDLARGAIEFWFKPDYASTDGFGHALGGYNFNGANNWLFEKDSTNNLRFSITNVAQTSEIVASPAQYNWRANDWVHLRFEWDDTQPIASQLRIFVNGVQRNPGGGTGVDYTSASNPSTNFRIGRRNPTPNGSPGVYDEIRVYGGSATAPTLLAYGGLAGHASEFLGRGANNFDLTFAPVDTDTARRGKYLYLGSDGKFWGVNIDLATDGVGTPDLQWQYWNGTAWASLEAVGGFTDETSNLTQRGTMYWTSDPGGWVPYSVNGGPDLYFVRAYLINGTSYTTTPVEGLIKTDVLLFQYCDTITTNAQTFDFALPAPTAVDLVELQAVGLDSAVELSWRTASELDNLGFQLYRATSAEGPYERITSSLLPGLGSSPVGAQYAYQDVGLDNGVTYYYKLEDVETTGRTKLHGPVHAVPSPGDAREGRNDDESPAPSPEPGSTRITYGDPAANALRMLQKNHDTVVLELVTEGFYAEGLDDGSIRIEVPGLELVEEFDLPVKRAWVDALSKGAPRLLSVQESRVVSLEGLRPALAGRAELQATWNGVVRAGRARRRSAPRDEHVSSPRFAARIVSDGFQGNDRRVLVELAPLSMDASTGGLRLARRLEVTLAFRGPDPNLRRRQRVASRGIVSRLVTRDRGLHAIGFEDVFGARGRDVPAGQLRLSRQGEDVHYHLEPPTGVFGPGSTLYFVSEGGAANPYGTEAVFELEVGVGGEVMGDVDAMPRGSAVHHYYWHELELEENRLYQAGLLQAPDLWLWDVILDPTRKVYPFKVSGMAEAPETAELSVWLQGASDLDGVDHHVRLYVNESFVAEARWDGKEAVTVRAALSPGVLNAGENRLAIENAGDTGAAYSMVMLNRFRLRYPRGPNAEHGRFEGSFDSAGVFGLHGVSSKALAVDLTGSAPVWLTGLRASPDGSVRFTTDAGRRYLVVSPEALLRPEVSAVTPSHLARLSRGADYVAIGPRAFLDVAEPLLKLRRRQGLRVAAVATEDIYSELGFGEARPEAIAAFVESAYHDWKRAPRYVVLLGDGTYDFEDHLGTGTTNRVPPLMVKTSYLWTASDPAYAAVHGADSMPDLAIGRLPAATSEELSAMVHKILAYESGPTDTDGPVVLVADNTDRAGHFEAHAEEIASSLLSDRDVQKIYASSLGPARTHEEILRAFDDGASLMSYLGHGGIHLWAAENLFDIDDTEQLAPQSEQPLLLTMNCLNGYFHFPYFDSLAESLLKADGRGVIAAFSPTGLSLDAPAHRYHKAVLGEILSGRHERLGDAILAGQRAYAETGSFLELLSIYHLLGDPALQLR